MVRLAGMQDLQIIAGLYHRVWHETHGSHMPRAECEARDEGFFLSRMTSLMPNVILGAHAGKIVGFAAWNGNLLGQLFVDPVVRGSGIAQQLMEAAERSLHDQGVQDAELHCLVGNARARRFYERVGWRVSETMAELVGTNVDSQQRDFWVMRKRLIPSVSQLPKR